MSVELLQDEIEALRAKFPSLTVLPPKTKRSAKALAAELLSGFVWADTREGYGFWRRIYRKLGGTFL